MALVRWRFEDTTEGDSYTFAINPNEGGSPNRAKSIQFQKTSASDGKTLVFEGLDEPKTSQFSGVILTQAYYDAMIDWFGRRHPIKVIDDLGREFIIYITKLDAKRQRAVHYPWKHQYTVDYIILEEL